MNIEISQHPEHLSSLFTREAKEFLQHMHSRFEGVRRSLLEKRRQRYGELRQGKNLGFLPETQHIRDSEWQVASAPHDLNDRRVEITGPIDRKMIINALNSGASVFMADCEDAQCPRWDLMLDGHMNLKDAVRRQIDFSQEGGKSYRLNDKVATLVVRPRGWHLDESHVVINGNPISASLFDFSLYFFHNAQELLNRESGPYFYLPKMESHLEARLWADVFKEAENYLNIRQGSIRATVLIETIPAAFEMDEILYELREYASGLNAGRWDYIFSLIKKLGHQKQHILPDRQQVTMSVPFMRSYADLLVKTCHKRGAHAIGGMAAFIPNRKDIDVTEKALLAVKNDKEREVRAGFDGSWIAHPDLLPTVKAVFDTTLGSASHQKHVKREDVIAKEEDLLATQIEGAQITENGLRINISVSLQYISHWLGGLGAVAINNLMEDAATAEISRTQIWQWLQHKVPLSDGRIVNENLYHEIKTQEVAKLPQLNNKEVSIALLDSLVLSAQCPEFLTLPASKILNS